MIRKTTTLLAAGFITLSGLTAMAAPKAHHKKASLAVATEGAAPAEKTDKVEKKAPKSTKGGKDKAAPAPEGTTTPAPAGEKMPEKK